MRQLETSARRSRTVFVSTKHRPRRVELSQGPATRARYRRRRVSAMVMEVA